MVRSTSEDRGFAELRAARGGNFSLLGGLEPAVFLDLMVSHGFQRWLGAHHDHGLKLTIDFFGLAADKKFANIKFRHVSLSLRGNEAGQPGGMGQADFSASMAVVDSQRRS